MQNLKKKQSARLHIHCNLREAKRVYLNVLVYPYISSGRAYKKLISQLPLKKGIGAGWEEIFSLNALLKIQF